MKLYNVIKNRIYRDDVYTFNLGEFRIPKLKYNLFLRRQESLTKNDSILSEYFRKDLGEWHPGTYIREFPVPIEDTALWESLTKKFNVEGKLSTKYFLIDYAFPNRNFCIEIDGSAYHNTSVNYDKARDEYIYLQLGWKVFRLIDYTHNDFKTFCDIYKSRIIKSLGIRDLYTDLAVNDYVQRLDSSPSNPDENMRRGKELIKKLSIILSSFPTSVVSEHLYLTRDRLHYLIGKVDRKTLEKIKLLYNYLFGNELRIT